MSKFIKTFLFILVVAGAVIYFTVKGVTAFNASRPQENVSNSPVISYTTSASISQPVVSTQSVQTTPVTVKTKVNTYYKTPTYKQVSVQNTLGYSVPSGYTRGQVSPFYQKVKISSAYSSFYSGYPSQIQLYSYFTEKSQRIDITGWKIKSNKNEIVIPQAVNLYDLSGYSVDSDIILNPNSSVSVYSNRSVVSRNLRLNKCMGYLENSFSFVPSLPQNCPKISRSEISYLSGQCQSYIISLNTCQIPNVQMYNSFGGDDGNKCRAFLSDINYTSCVKKYSNDADFYLNDWKVWANRVILDAEHDTVKLLDSNGLLVDQYIY